MLARSYTELLNTKYVYKDVRYSALSQFLHQTCMAGSSPNAHVDTAQNLKTKPMFSQISLCKDFGTAQYFLSLNQSHVGVNSVLGETLFRQGPPVFCLC